MRPGGDRGVMRGSGQHGGYAPHNGHRRAVEPATPEQVRATLRGLAEHYSESLAGLSRLVGRNQAYLQQFLERGVPQRLPEDVRLRLARYFRVDERDLGARDPWVP